MSVDTPGKRTLIVGNFLGAIASRSVSEDMAERLQKLGWQVVTTSDRAGRFARLFDMLQTTWTQQHRYDVATIDVFSGAAFFWAEAVSGLLRRIGKPQVLILHGGNLPVFAQRWPRRVKRLLKSANAVITPSRYLFEQMGDYRSDLSLLANPLDLNAYAYAPRKTAAPKLIWLRAFHEIYNPAMAVKVIALLKSEFPDIRLTMIGPDKGDGSLQRVRQLAIELGVQTHIDIPGKVPKAQVPEWMSKGDIFINTTQIDNTPVSVMEAMASGLCVVSTKVGGIPYLLEHERDALLVPPDDHRAMAQAIGRILTSAPLAQHLSQNAREKARKFDWSLILPQWDALLTSLCGAKLDR